HHDLHAFPTRRSSDLRVSAHSRNAGEDPIPVVHTGRNRSQRRLTPSAPQGRPHFGCYSLATQYRFEDARTTKLAAQSSLAIDGRSEEHTSELQSRVDL